MAEITGGALGTIRVAARPLVGLQKTRREDGQVLWNFCFEPSLLC